MADSAVLSSWSDGWARQSILDFVGEVTTVGGPDFVPVSDRIAVFDLARLFATFPLVCPQCGSVTPATLW
jgi:hypothetical protein